MANWPTAWKITDSLAYVCYSLVKLGAPMLFSGIRDVSGKLWSANEQVSTLLYPLPMFGAPKFVDNEGSLARLGRDEARSWSIT